MSLETMLRVNLQARKTEEGEFVFRIKSSIYEEYLTREKNAEQIRAWLERRLGNDQEFLITQAISTALGTGNTGKTPRDLESLWDEEKTIEKVIPGGFRDRMSKSFMGSTIP